MSSRYFKTLNVKVEHEPENGKFYIPFSPEPVSLSYQAEGETWKINEVRVPQEARKLKMGTSLMEFVVETAKRDNLKVDPACAYAKNFFARFPRYQELLD